MKAFIIHTVHPKSKHYAQRALDSFRNYKGWEPELFLGVDTTTLPLYEGRFRLKTKPRSRAADFLRKDPKRYPVKKSCSFNHYRLFKLCEQLNEPIAVIEHDSHCVGDWKGVKFQDVLVLNARSATKQKALKDYTFTKDMLQKGVHPINLGLLYRHDPLMADAHIMPGTAAYAVTPEGAAKMIKVYETIGWEQSDHIINTGYVKIQTIIPELFTFKLPNLKMSHGENML